ncbi:MAG: tRNA (guanosine(37)-N1)-methyltransferase TrmD [Elusimicrobia bacterium RIFOXYA2_FULL_40_6]|nr:MAG: tRNA (guanosine(37)-N1)-methyltransferase TrmD [Elusimicrobia bacterium RIFOXYA2_FULL_40_6]
MRIDIITLFPDMFPGVLNESIVGRAQKKGIIEIHIHNLRDFSGNKNRIIDDKPFGGGSGMVIQAEPVYKAVEFVKKQAQKKQKTKVIFLSPQGRLLNHKTAKDLSKEKHLVFLCGHYEGIDERVMDMVDLEISIGDYVLTGGELPAMVLADAVARLVPGVVKEESSIQLDSFANGLLDYPHYTRPRVFGKLKVPDTLFSGNHKEIEKWRAKGSLRNTLVKRPDLLKNIKLTDEQNKYIKEIIKECPKTNKVAVLGFCPTQKMGEKKR